jgi:hypothetical protein
MAVRLVECVSCGAVIEAGEAAVDSEQDLAVLLEQAPELARAWCQECWAERSGA